VLEQPYEFVQAQRTRLHEDLAILTGGLPVSTELSVSLHAIQLSQLGEADRVVIDGQTTTIIAGAGNEDAVAARIEQLRSELAAGDDLNEFELDKPAPADGAAGRTGRGDPRRRRHRARAARAPPPRRGRRPRHPRGADRGRRRRRRRGAVARVRGDRRRRARSPPA